MAKRRPAGDGLVRKRSDGRWEGRIVVGHKADGSPIFRSVFAKTQGELLKKLHSRMEEYRDVELTEESGMTLGQWLDKWLADYMTLTVRESTLNSYKSITEHHISPCLGTRKSAPSPPLTSRKCTTGSGRTGVSASIMRREMPCRIPLSAAFT